ncbi:Hypothetical predicted protein, partial [Pelobates cultripes]
MKGVAILLRTSCPLEDITALKDPLGRFLFLTAYVGTTVLSICSLYAPSAPDATFWENFRTHLAGLTTKHVIIGGDCNATQSAIADRRVHNGGTPATTCNDKLFTTFLNDTSFID